MGLRVRPGIGIKAEGLGPFEEDEEPIDDGIETFEPQLDNGNFYKAY